MSEPRKLNIGGAKARPSGQPGEQRTVYHAAAGRSINTPGSRAATPAAPAQPYHAPAQTPAQRVVYQAPVQPAPQPAPQPLSNTAQLDPERLARARQEAIRAANERAMARQRQAEAQQQAQYEEQMKMRQEEELRRRAAAEAENARRQQEYAEQMRLRQQAYYQAQQQAQTAPPAAPAAPAQEQRRVIHRAAPTTGATPTRVVRQPAQSPARQAPQVQQVQRQVQPAPQMQPQSPAQQMPVAQQPRANVQRLDLNAAAGHSAGQLYDMESDTDFEQNRVSRPAPHQAQAAQAEPNMVHRSVGNPPPAKGRGNGKPSAGSAKHGNGGGKPPKGGKGRGNGGDDGGKGKNGKGKKKMKWWQILLITLLALVLIFGITIALIVHAIAPSAGVLSLNDLINTPKEYSGDYLNVLVCGVDWEEDRADMYSDSANDGMTDMIMYVHMDFVENKVSMLQIPRNALVTADASIAGNYQINSVARTQGTGGNNDYGALMNIINEEWKLPVDGYVSINMQSFKEIVDTLGGVEVYVPHEISYGGSTLSEGYQTMDGTAAEFFVRNRKGEGYANSDLDRLNMQRYFYSGLFRRLKTMTAWDVARMMPLFVKYCDTNLSASDIISLGVSMLKIDSSNMMMCQMPVFMGCPEYNGNSIVAAARQADADLLNTYFRGTMGSVAPEDLGTCFDLVSTDGLTASDANVQQMGALNEEASAAQQNNNLDGSNQVTYADPTPTPVPAS